MNCLDQFKLGYISSSRNAFMKISPIDNSIEYQILTVLVPGVISHILNLCKKYIIPSKTNCIGYLMYEVSTALEE